MLSYNVRPLFTFSLAYYLFTQTWDFKDLFAQGESKYFQSQQIVLQYYYKITKFRDLIQETFPIQQIKALSTLGTIFRRQYIEFSSYFFLENRIDISCKLFLMEIICMKCKNLFSGKNKKNTSICLLLKIVPRVISIKRLISAFLYYSFWRYHPIVILIDFLTLFIYTFGQRRISKHCRHRWNWSSLINAQHFVEQHFDY